MSEGNEENITENEIETVEQREKGTRKKTSRSKSKKSGKKKTSKETKESKRHNTKKKKTVKHEEKEIEKKIEEEKKEEEEKKLEEEKKEEEEEKKEEEIPKIEYADENLGPQFSEEIYLRKCIKNKNNNINEMSKDQDQFKNDLHSLLQKLNDTLTQNAEILYKKPQEDDYIKIEKLNYIANIKRKDIQISKSKNKIFKEQYELLSNRFKNTNADKIDEIEYKLDEIKFENNKLTKDIREYRNKQNVKAKVLETYSANKKYPKEIKSYTEEVKTLSTKKHEYYLRLNKNKKSLMNLIEEFEKTEKIYNELHDKENFFNRNIEEDLNKIRKDLTGDENTIFEKAENKSSIILQEHEEKMEKRELYKSRKFLKSIDNKNINIGKSSNLLISNNSKKNYDKYNYNPNLIRKKYAIVVREKSAGKEKNPISNKEFYNIDKELNANYDNTTDYEYRNMITKKEKYFDVNIKLEKSIKEVKKMYERKVKDSSIILDENMKKLNTLLQENDLLQKEIEDLKKIQFLNEDEERLRQEDYIEENNISDKKLIKGSNKNSTKDLNIHSNNNDVSETRNDILNDLNVFNENEVDNKILEENINEKDKNMKFPDISNIEENKEDKFEIDRNKVLADIKKKYGVKVHREDDDYQKEIDKEEREKLEKELEEEKNLYNNQNEENKNIQIEKY